MRSLRPFAAHDATIQTKLLTFILTYVLVPFVTALPLTAEPAPYPDPNQDQAAADAPARTTRLRRLLGKLITHGRLLIEDLTRRPSAMLIFSVAITFGAKDIALIIARLTRGLQLAAALKATLPNDKQPARRTCPARPAPAERKPRSRPTPRKAVLLALPTSKEIAERLHTHSIGDILVEICRDLGIHPRSFLWRELEGVIRENGGDFDSFAEAFERQSAISVETFCPPDLWRTPPPPSPAPRLPATAPAGATGPP